MTLPPDSGIEALEDNLSTPTQGVINAMARIEGDLVILGAGGKMGPTLARMARRASDAAGVQRRVIGVSRFSQPGLEASLQQYGVETVACDLLDPAAAAALPEAPNVIFMMGMKFGTTGNEARTWAVNVLGPAHAAERYAASRFAVLSTGNVYGLSEVASGGAKETDPLLPVGEYAMSALGRERVFEFAAETRGTRAAILRLYYAYELRYGVPVDVARKVWNGAPIDLAMGHASVIWQGDANAQVIESLLHASAPPTAINLSGPAIVSIRELALRFGALLGREPVFTGIESPTAIVCNTTRSQELFGPPATSMDRACGWIAEWVKRGGDTLGKPTHFEDRGGQF